MWDEIREKFFTNLVFDSMNAVEDKLEEAMIFYDKKREIVKSITGFNWITPYLQIATWYKKHYQAKKNGVSTVNKKFYNKLG